jgi:hypothetical protein
MVSYHGINALRIQRSLPAVALLHGEALLPISTEFVVSVSVRPFCLQGFSLDFFSFFLLWYKEMFGLGRLIVACAERSAMHSPVSIPNLPPGT